MYDIQEVIKMVYCLYRDKPKQPDSPCPGEEDLVCFLEGNSKGPDSEKIYEHVASCSRCLEVAYLFYQKAGEEMKVPEHLIEGAKELTMDEPGINLLKIIAAIKEQTLEILDANSDIILGNEIMPLPIVRSRKLNEFPEEATLIKELNNIKITVNIKKLSRLRVRVSLNLVDRASLQPIGGLRLSLLKGGIELESYVAKSGSVVFSEIRAGHYDIEILSEGQKLGMISLEIQ